MQDYGHSVEDLVVKQGEALYGLITELMCRQHDLSNFLQLFPVIGMDGKERITFFNLITDLAMDEKTHSMVNGVGLTSAPGSKSHRSLSNAPRLDLRQVTCLR